MNSRKGFELYNKAKRLIPGGTQLLSKRPEMFLPDQWPSYYAKAKGCEVWDMDGNHYYDFAQMGVGTCILGYADEDVDAAVKGAVEKGSMCTLNAPEEVELAELLCELHPWAEMVRYARSGGEAMAMAVRIARAATGKDAILFCGYHGWHDWYLSANLADDSALDGHLLPGLSPKGVPRPLKSTSLPFTYNDTQGFLSLVDKYRNSLAGIVLEAVRNVEPEREFIAAIREAAGDQGAPFIVDEITSGWRLNIGGAHMIYGFEPDISVFAKGMSNGYPMAAVIGRAKFMNAAQESFISSTYWTDRIGPTAALASIRKMRANNIPRHLIAAGKIIQEAWWSSAIKHGLDLDISGIYPLSHFVFKHKDPLILKTLFTQLMLDKGFLATTAVYTSYAHDGESLDKYLNAVDDAFGIIAQALRDGNPERRLRGPVCHAGFKRLT